MLEFFSNQKDVVMNSHNRLKKNFLLLAVLISIAKINGMACDTKKAVVIKPFIDLMYTPKGGRNMLLTQFLFNELITITGETKQDSNGNQWLRIESHEQTKYAHSTHDWKKYRGFIRSSDVIIFSENLIPNAVIKKLWAPIYQSADSTAKPCMELPLGAHVMVSDAVPSENGMIGTVLPDENGLKEYFIHQEDVYFLDSIIREDYHQLCYIIGQHALAFEGMPYTLGGRSPISSDKNRISSVDCSGLVNLAYRACGLLVPRKAHAQFLVSQKVTCAKDLQPGDLIFFGSTVNGSMYMNHVVLYLGDGMAIEANGKGLNRRVRIILLERLCRLPLEAIYNGCLCTEGVRRGNNIFLGTFRNSLQYLREATCTMFKGDSFFLREAGRDAAAEEDEYKRGLTRKFARPINLRISKL